MCWNNIFYLDLGLAAVTRTNVTNISYKCVEIIFIEVEYFNGNFKCYILLDTSVAFYGYQLNWDDTFTEIVAIKIGPFILIF